MPGATLPNMGIVLGDPGEDDGTWGEIVNDALTLVDEHNHTSGQGAPIPTAGLAIDADLSFASLYAATNLHRISFAEIALLASNNRSLFVSTDHELYWRTNSGTNVKVTNGAALNVSAFAGAIGGDYSAVSAALNFDSGGGRYTFRGALGTNWTKIAAGDLRLFQDNTNETVFVGQAAPTALVASYTATWPLALPTSSSPLFISSAGQMTVGQTIVLSPALTAVESGGTQPTFSATGRITLGLSSQRVVFPIQLPVGATLTSWRVRINKTSTSGTISAGLVRMNIATDGAAGVGGTPSNNANNPGLISLEDTGLAITIAADEYLILQVTPSGVTGDSIVGARVVLG